MPYTVTKHVEPWQTLDFINAAIPQEEKTFGPLLTIDHDTNSTVLTFAFSTDDPPSPTAVIAAEVAGKPQLPDGATLIDEGLIFVEGVLVLCAATRG